MDTDISQKLKHGGKEALHRQSISSEVNVSLYSIKEI